MAILGTDRSTMALIGDNEHSAHTIADMVTKANGPSIEYFGGTSSGTMRLQGLLSNCQSHWPDAVILDIPTFDAAAIDQVMQLAGLVYERGVALVVTSPALGRADRQALHDAGAAAVFFRQGDNEAFRREIDGIISFWARLRRLDAVGM